MKLLSETPSRLTTSDVSHPSLLCAKPVPVVRYSFWHPGDWMVTRTTPVSTVWTTWPPRYAPPPTSPFWIWIIWNNLWGALHKIYFRSRLPLSSPLERLRSPYTHSVPVPACLQRIGKWQKCTKKGRFCLCKINPSLLPDKGMLLCNKGMLLPAGSYAESRKCGKRTLSVVRSTADRHFIVGVFLFIIINTIIIYY